MAGRDTKTDPSETAAVSPRDPVTGMVRPTEGPSDRPGTEAEEAPRRNHGPDRERPDDAQGPGRDGERAAAYRENDA